MEKEIIYKEESYKIIGICMEVHNTLGGGLLEEVYKDAICYELDNEFILFEREKEFKIKYKDVILKHKYFADLVVYDDIILEVKACACLTDAHIAQTLNYVKISGGKLGILVNFGLKGFEYKRLVI